MTTEMSGTINRDSPAGRVPVEEGMRPPLDVGLLGQVILELNIARNNFSIYPLGHRQISTSIDRAFGLLDRLMTQRHDLILGFTKNHIFADRKQLDFRNPVYREFSHALHRLDIAAISFARGLTKEEVFDFIRIITQSIEHGDGQSGVVQAMNEANILHIRIEEIDYSRFFLTEEAEIVPAESIQNLKSKDIWREFVEKLLSDNAFGNIGQNMLTDIQPSDFAYFLNERKIDPAVALKNFQKILKEKYQLDIDNQPDLRLDTLLKNLQPELRQQFLAITFDYVSKGSTEFLKNFTSEIVLEMLIQANAEHKNLSPSLITLLEKLSHADGSMQMHSEMIDIVNSAADSEAVKENLHKLLEQEAYDKYVDGSYSAMLQRLSEMHSQSGEHHPESSNAEDDHHDAVKLPLTSDGLSDPKSWAKVFDEKYQYQHLCHLALAIMDQDHDLEIYRGFAEKLVSEAVRLIDFGAFDIILMMISAFQRHSQEKSPAIRLVAVEGLQKMTASELIPKILNVVQEGSSDQIGTASEILTAIGKSTIPGIMSRYIEEESPAGIRALSELLKSLGKDALEAAYLQLKDPRIPVLRKILTFLREAGSDESIPHIMPLISHSDALIRLDVLSALLQFKDVNAVDYLRHFLQSKDFRECLDAIQLSGVFRVEEVVDDLSNLLTFLPWRKREYRKNIEIIKSLGKIGDPDVLPLLARLSRKTFSIYPESQKKMKIAFYESLHGYPRESISRILEHGKKADDFRIRTICRNLSIDP